MANRPIANEKGKPSASLFHVPLWEAFLYWLKLGFISFGGPAGQIALMHTELVERRRWISEQRFLHALNYCMLLPGPEATQLAIYIGWLMHRTLGGIIAGVLFVLPSLLLLIGLSWAYMAYGSLPAIAGILYGMKPAVVAIVLAAAWRIGKRTLRNRPLMAIALAAFIAISFVKLPFPAIVAGAALLGWAGGRLRPELFALGGAAHGPATADGAHAPALIDDGTPTPPHARFSWSGLARVIAAGIVLMAGGWLSARLAVRRRPAAGANGLVLYQSRDDDFWRSLCRPALRLPGRRRALPLADASPDGRWPGLGRNHARPPDHGGGIRRLRRRLDATSGCRPSGPGRGAGASVAAWFTFVPSFVFILAGGPLVESTRGNIRMTAPLTAISAAVVGVIASLALFFGIHVFHPADHWEWPAVAIAAAAAIALMQYKQGTIRVLVACAIAGIVLSYRV